MSEVENKSSLHYEAPYPLKTHYVRKILPTLVVLAMVIGVIVAFGSQYLIHQIYLQISADKAEVIDRALAKSHEGQWQLLQGSEKPAEVFFTSDGKELLKEIRKEITELGLKRLKIYNSSGFLLYSSDESKIGTQDISAGLEDAIAGNNNLSEIVMEDGNKLYELYVLVPNNPNNIVIELYEPIAYLDSITFKAIVPAISFPILLLIVLALITGHLISRAQSDINYRTEMLRSFSKRLAKLLSFQAVNQLRDPITSSKIPSKKIRATILFTDIRGFTDFCERSDPQKIVSFLNASLGEVIRAINLQGGDVDKIIGDAVLGFFVGDNAEKRALNAALQCQSKLQEEHLNPGIGIGIYTGDVISGAIGDSERMDYTLIGDSVNVASRLCSSAKVNEIIIDEKSYIASGGLELEVAAVENVRMKGRKELVTVCRLIVEQ